MTADAKPELPPGYSWQECRGTGAFFPKPEGWLHTRNTFPGTVGFAIFEKVDREGFTTGMEMNVFPHLQERGIVPIDMAKEHVTNQRFFTRIEDLTRQEDETFTTFRALYRRSTSMLVMGRFVQPATYFIEGTANKSTGTTYLITFHTLNERWLQDEQTARLIIERRILDGSF
jgi:hypothetical protein